MEWKTDDYIISTDKISLSPTSIQSLLKQSYWAKQRPITAIQKSIENSICFGIYHESGQVGFARIVTDYSTMYWISDVIIDEAHRGKGLGKDLIRCMLEIQEIQGLNGILMTNDAHGLYEKYGFFKLQDHAMVRVPPAE